jgi:hypothetical protein
VDNFEYKIHINEDGGIPNLRRATKLFVGIHEDGNTLEFKKSHNNIQLRIASSLCPERIKDDES